MPNHCNNQLTISATPELITKIKKSIITKTDPNKITGEDYELYDFSFQSVIPCKEDQDCNEIWSTKWDAYDVCVSFPNNKLIHIDFDTAWSPPDKVVSKLKELFPKADLRLLYYEPGCGFAGDSDGITNLYVEYGSREYKHIATTFFGAGEDELEEQEELKESELTTK